MKQSIIILGFLFAMGLTGCLKDTPNVDFTQIKPIVEFSTANFAPTPNSIIAGVENFGSATLNLTGTDPITETVYVNYASNYPPTSDVNVTIGVNDAARTAFNNNGSSVQYDLLPDSVYTIANTTGTIKAGSRLWPINITFYPAKIDPTKSYMLPLSIVSTSAGTISGNFGIVYLHIVGNYLAGTYNVTGTRTNYVGSTTTVSGTTNLANVKTAIPDDPTHIELPYANVGGGITYIITYDPAAGPTSATAALSSAAFDANGLTNYGIDSFTFDAASRTFTIVSHYTNGAGNNRSITETFTHQ